MPRLMMSRPCAASCTARASTAKAFSSPIRSKAATVFSMAFPGIGYAARSSAQPVAKCKYPAPGQSPKARSPGVDPGLPRFAKARDGNSADDVVSRAGLQRIGAAAAGCAIRIGADVGLRIADRGVLQALIGGRRMTL